MTHNLPAPISALIGRDQDLIQVGSLLSTSRLVTLVGAGGVGKTQLALQVATATLPRFADGARLVELAAVPDAHLVASAVAEGVGVAQRAGQPLVDTLRDALRERNVLLVLDNCEHVLTECALVAAGLLRTCGGLRILATSRERMGIVGEMAWRVPSLAQPPENGSLAEIERAPAVRLFVERAAGALPSFALTAHNAAAVGEVCRRLDGMPLALELAAARASLLSPRQIAAHLDNRFRLLTAGSRTAPRRQQTLRAAIDWSYDLLSEPERVLLRRLSTFAGSWSLDAVHAVCGAPDLHGDVLLDVLGELVEKSLVVADAHGDEMHYRLLETVRQYARERLAQAEEANALRRHHLAWCLELAERVPPERLDANQVALLDEQQDDLRAALGWSVEAGHTADGLRLAIGCWPLWYLRGRFAEGRSWFSALQELPAEVEVQGLRARALACEGHLAFCEGDSAAAESLLRAGLELAEDSGDATALCGCSLYLGHVVGLRRSRAESEALYERALAMARAQESWAWQTRALMALARSSYERGEHRRAAGFVADAMALFDERDHPTSRARVTALKGRLASAAGDHAAARACAEAALELLDRLGDRQGQAYARGLAAQSAFDRGDRVDAARHLGALLALTRETNERIAVARGLEGVVELLAECAPEQAARLTGLAEGVRDTAALSAAPVELRRLEEAFAGIRRRIGAAAASAHRLDGRARSLGVSIPLLSDELAAAEAVSRTTAEVRVPAVARRSGLTRREQEVAVLVARGLDSRHIAHELVIAEGTVRIHVEHILAKLELHSRAQLAAWVVEHDLLKPA